MKDHILWRKIEEAQIERQADTALEDDDTEIGIHLEDKEWYPEYY